jgi:hypothetical protein
MFFIGRKSFSKVKENKSYLPLNLHPFNPSKRKITYEKKSTRFFRYLYLPFAFLHFTCPARS